jgi:hypothetical protein
MQIRIVTVKGSAMRMPMMAGRNHSHTNPAEIRDDKAVGCAHGARGLCAYTRNYVRRFTVLARLGSKSVLVWIVLGSSGACA